MSGAKVVVVTGLAGAGKSTALRALEDLGFFCVDNLPLALIDRAVVALGDDGIDLVALGVHVRLATRLERVGEVLEAIVGAGRALEVLFLDAKDEAILRRFSETRRPHPLAAATSGAGGAGPLLEAIVLERERLAPLRERATSVIDTSNLSVHALRGLVLERFGGQERQAEMRVRVVSFGFKYGPPADADLVFDVRFLDNPHFVGVLRPKSGLDAPVRAFVLDTEGAIELLVHVEALLTFALPRYAREGKSYLTVAVGCTGGRHRSVALAEELGARLRRATGRTIVVAHRDLGRADSPRRSDAGSSASEGASASGAPERGGTEGP